MHRLVSSLSALAADRWAENEFSYPPELLMEEAGIRLQDQVDRLVPSGPLLYLAGPGNNGGDAWVMARQAHLRGRTVVVVSAVEPSSELCRRQADRARRVGVPVALWPSPTAEEELRKSGVWIDGLWGVGLKASLRDNQARLVAEFDTLRRTTGSTVLAVDVPSGLWPRRTSAEPVLRARWTLTPGPLKDFCYYPANREACGTLIGVPLAYPVVPSATGELLEEGDLASLLPPIDDHVHKGQRGHVAVLGGAPGMIGALVLAGRSAAASGAGLVTLGVDASLIGVVAPQVPAFQVRTPDALMALVSRFDSVVLGPGWGRDADRRLLLERWWATDLPMVVDADGLAAWVDLGCPSRSAPTVLTPHPGEFVRLGWGDLASVEAAGQLARERGVTVVLKGSATWIAGSDGRLRVWDGGEPALATGGSGDCLAGVVGALMARTDAFGAASAAVLLHGSAGRTLSRSEGWFTADRLPDALARLASACRTSATRL